MDTLSAFSSSYIDVFMDTSQDFDPSQGSVVRWVASQTPNPALQALMREAERDRRTRPSTPVDEPMSWTYPLASTTSSPASLSTSLSSAWHSSGHGSADVPRPPGSSSSASSSTSAARASEPSVSRRAGLFAAQRRPLGSSTSSASQPLRHSVRPRSSSHSISSDPSISKGRHAQRDDEQESLHFMELLKQTTKQVDVNALIKQERVRSTGKGNKREEYQDRNGADDHMNANNSKPRALTKTTSASAVCLVNSSAKASEKTLTASTPACIPERRVRALEKEPSSIGLLSGKSVPASIRDPNLNCDPKPVPVPRLSTGASNTSITNRTTRKPTLPEPTSNDGDSAMQDVIDLTDTDTDVEKRVPGPSSRTDTAMCVDLDDEESDTGMDVSFYNPELLPRPRVPPPKLNPQPPPPTRLATASQRTRTGPPPLGMRRAAQLQPSQYSSTQNSRSMTVPRFKPPLLTNTESSIVGGSSSRHGSGTTPAAARPLPRGSSARPPVPQPAPPAPTSNDPDSSFDVSFGLDGATLEEAMRAYD